MSNKKTQLNKTHRERLFYFTRKRVEAPAEAKAAYQKVLDECIPLLIKEIENKYPQDHMRILALYECAKVDRCLKLVISPESFDRVEINIPEDIDFPLMARRTDSCRAHFVSIDAYHLAVNIRRAQKTLQEAKNSLIQDYDRLIVGSKNFEDLCEIWPEAEELAGEIVNSRALPSALNTELLDRIRKNVEERAVAK